MKPLILILTLLVQIGFTQTRQDEVANDITGFNAFLGKEKSTALNAAVKSFDKFLLTNYREHDNSSDRIRKFLEDFRDHFNSLPNWKFATKKNKTVLNHLETSGMRKEMWVYGYEDYASSYRIESLLPKREATTIDFDSLTAVFDLEEEIIPIRTLGLDSLEEERLLQEEILRNDSTFGANINGQFLYALAKFAPTDRIIQEYVDAKFSAGDISPLLVIGAKLEMVSNFDEPFVKRIIVAETYYHLMRIDNEK